MREARFSGINTSELFNFGEVVMGYYKKLATFTCAIIFAGAAASANT